jgi:hypothetical protein
VCVCVCVCGCMCVCIRVCLCECTCNAEQTRKGGSSYAEVLLLQDKVTQLCGRS